MRKLVLVCVGILFLSGVFASCSKNQININTASLEELDELYGVGEAKAQAIVDARPYDFVDELVNAKGIGEATLEKIKEQGLACVDENYEKEKDKDNDFEKEYKKDVEEENELPEIEKFEEVAEKPKEVIVLAPKVIKSENVNEESGDGEYAIYGFIGFCILLGFLLIVNKRNLRKNEFR